jgi:nucleotide-binding universal stress UspA family protein
MTGSISTVAVGTDGSPTAGRALAAAFELAERYGARLVVLSAFQSPARSRSPRLSGGSSGNLEWDSNAAEQVERILAMAEESAAARGLECETAVGEGEPGEVLVSLAEQHGADLLVVGNRGMERRVLGSVPNTVSHKATCSVLIVKTA